MLSVISSCALAGIEAIPVTVEVDVSPGLPGFNMVGLPDSAVKEARERVFSALKNSGFTIPSKRITINLAPGGIRKEGTAFDLALALGLLLASEQVALPSLPPTLFMGELSLDGSLRPVRGVLPAALHAKSKGRAGRFRLVVPLDNGEEAALVPGVEVCPVGSLLETLEFLGRPGHPLRRPTPRKGVRAVSEPDFSEVKGQEQAKRALEIAAAGGHNFLMVGSPGCGKTLLARRIPSILPPMSEEEGLETTRIYSVAGLLDSGAGLIRQRPFRAPHHGISDQALIGGGSMPRPGELSLAHNGLLFLDEFPEFHRHVVEMLRQPLEEGAITISRASHSVTYPCRVMLGLAFNPCPCGRMMDPRRSCRCRIEEIVRYRARLSGPMLDRIDIHLEMPSLSYGELTGSGGAEGSAEIRARVERARDVQRRRFRSRKPELMPATGGGAAGGDNPAIHCNAHMSGRQLQAHCAVKGEAASLLKDAVVSLGLSARAYDRILKVGRTVADLDGCEGIREEHIAEAIHYRCLDRQLSVFD
jgi:magnesium chelatase family protein